MATKKPKKRKYHTLEERDEIDERIAKETGNPGFTITRDGVEYTIDADGNMVPLTGKQAQEIVKKKRKKK